MNIYISDTQQVCVINLNIPNKNIPFEDIYSDFFSNYGLKPYNNHPDIKWQGTEKECKLFGRDMLVLMDLDQRLLEMKDLKLDAIADANFKAMIARAECFKTNGALTKYFQAVHAFLDVFLMKYYDLRESTDTNFDVKTKELVSKVQFPTLAQIEIVAVS